MANGDNRDLWEKMNEIAVDVASMKQDVSWLKNQAVGASDGLADVATMKQDVSWLKQFFWAVMGGAITNIVGLIVLAVVYFANLTR